ncbi:hypothetical protein ACOMHN_026916 [Nucella lapillus]
MNAFSVVVEVAALGVAVVLRAAMVLGAARVFVVVVVRLPEVNEAASYAVVVHLHPSPQSLNDSSKASDVNSSPEARALNDTYLDTFTGRTWTCAQTCPAAQTASLSGRL